MGKQSKRKKITNTTYNVNKHGLSRTIPEQIKREIRQQCGFGCVICGCAIYHYEHIDPVFAEAKEHEPSKMALLCGGCHDKVTRGYWSKNKVKRALEQPKCFKQNFSSAMFDVDWENSEVILGCARFINTPNILEIRGTSLLRIDPPECISSPFRVTAIFFDSKGNKIFYIKENQWFGYTTNWDILVTNKKITIKNTSRKTILVIRVDAPKRLIIEKVEMFYKEFQIVGNEQELSFIKNSKLMMKYNKEITINSAPTGICIN